MAVTERRDITDQRDMERRSSFQNGIGILGNFVIQKLYGILITRLDGIFRADGETAPAADTDVMIDVRFFVLNDRSSVSTDAEAGAAADAVILPDIRLSVAVLFHFSGA